MNERLLKLRSDVHSLLQAKSDNSRQQINLDAFGKKSITVMQKNHFVVNSLTKTSLVGLTLVSLEVNIGGDIVLLPAAVATN